jgi:NADH-quinone oxidoreductase subunit N
MTTFLKAFEFDLGSSLIKLILLLLILSIHLISLSYLTSQKLYNYEYYILLLLSVVGLCFLAVTNNFLTAYLALELQSLAFYGLIAFKMDSEYTIEAAVKYFVLGALASCILLFGMSLLYLSCGTLSFGVFSVLYQSVAVVDNTVYLALVFILITVLLKLGVAPFHYWLCDVYEGSLIPLTALFSTAPKLIFTFLLTKLLYVAFYGLPSI